LFQIVLKYGYSQIRLETTRAVTFQPDHLSERRPTLALLTHGGGDPVSHYVWSGVENVARKVGVNLVCFPGKAIRSPVGFDSQSNILYELINRQKIDGVIIWLAGLTLQMSPYEVKAFCERYRPLPIVTVGVHVEGFPSVTVDNYHGMYNVVSHVLKVHGRSRVAFIRGPENHQEAEERYQAYRNALQESGLAFDPALVTAGGFKESGAVAGMEELLDQRRVHFDALVAASDNMAIAAIGLLQKRGIRVPDDVAVAGLNNESRGRVITPPLTTGPLHFYEQGQKAAEIVLDLLHGKPVQERVVLPTKLLVRQSCGCPDPLVIQAGAADVIETGKTLDAEKLAGEILLILEWPAEGKGLVEAGQLIEAFFRDSKSQDGAFLSVLTILLQRSVATEESISKWHEALSLLRARLLGFLEPENVSRAETIFQQARVVIGETSQRAQAFQRLQVQQHTRILSEVNQLLSATIDGAELLEILSAALPKLDIPRCYLSLYEDPGSPTTSSRLALAYDEQGRLDLAGKNTRFLSCNLIPDGLMDNRLYNLVVEPLYFRNDHLGFVLFEADSRQEEMYEALRGQISGALKRTGLAERNIVLYNEAVQARQVAEYGRQLAEQADSLKSRFLAMVSHELRTPLTLITGMIEMMLAENAHRQSILPDSYYRDLKSIRASAQHLGRLIGDVLDLASNQAGELHLSFEPLSLETVIREITLLSEAIVREKGLAWRVELTPNLPTIWADRTRLKQIILNLVSNAAKFTARGEVALKVAATENQVHINIKDTGLGIPLGEQEKIFDEFRQSERTTRRGYSGMGLGLAITRRLVELHNGKIEVHSSGDEGAGSEFHISLPSMAGWEPRPITISSQSQTVLLLSEQSNENPKLRDYLRQRGFQVVEMAIADHPNWVTSVMVDPPGALVLGMQLAEERGWELIQLLKKNPETQNIPVVFYTLSQEMGMGDALEFDYLTKPIGSDDLILALGRQGVTCEPGRNAQTVLIVDDDIDILNLHARIVRSHLKNCRTLTAQNGRDALDIIEMELPDLVLLDLMMPEMDGFAVLEVMRARERLRGIPVVVLTAQILTAPDMARLQRGVSAVLSKGMFSTGEVQKQIEAALARNKHLGTEAQRVTRQAMAYIHEHYGEPVTRGQLAQQVGLSERHLNRCFSIETGMPVMVYLNRYRVRQSKILLEKGEMNLTEIALTVGFSGSSHFSRVFRAEVGVSPGAYQRGGISQNG